MLCAMCTSACRASQEDSARPQKVDREVKKLAVAAAVQAAAATGNMFGDPSDDTRAREDGTAIQG